ncbi:MAG: LysR family transcriptional regulator ArgP [Microbacteriaceae bacterium]|nr:LysR family transcriptional regulator ArgP [Microbacteriaceae bacterium]
MELDLARLRALAAAVDHGSFEAAAVRLHVTPSAISQRIRALERQAGRVLLVRARPIVATEAGSTLLRVARQIDALAADAGRALDADGAVLPIAVNADSLATWVLPALAPLAEGIAFEFHRGDQSRTLELLRDGTVLAAISSEPETVQGCRMRRLGDMRYLPCASPAFVERWFADGIAAGLASAPMLVFDEHDGLQRRLLDELAPGSAPPRHRVPGSADFVLAAELGFGWGMVPEAQRTERLVPIVEGAGIDVPLHWHAWSLGTPALERAEAALVAATPRAGG